MNKFKAWLIRKLGGYVHMSEPPIIYRERPVITINFEVALPSAEWDKVINESGKIKLANHEAAKRIGQYIIDNGLCEITGHYDNEFKCGKVHYKTKVVQPINNFEAREGLVLNDQR